MSEAWKLFECCSHLNMIAHFSVMALNLTLSWNSSFYYKLRILLLTIRGKKKTKQLQKFHDGSEFSCQMSYIKIAD